jgi:hypothetical protein
VLSYRLPPLNNVYKGSFYIPFIGNQNIEFERLQANTSQVRLSGLINCNGYIYNTINDTINSGEDDDHDEDDETPMSYELDNLLKSIIRKYTCTIQAPYYNACNDTILFVLNIKILGLLKTIKLYKCLS